MDRNIAQPTRKIIDNVGWRVSGWSLWHEAANHPGRMTEDMTFEIRQRFFAIRTSALLLE